MIKQKFCSLDSDLNPFFLFLNLIIHHAKKPNLSGLQPYEFICIIDFAFLIETGKEPSVFLVNWICFPERDNLFDQFLMVQRGELVKVH